MVGRMPELLIGCGNAREKTIHMGRPEWDGLVTLDIDPNCNPDVEWDLERLPLPFGDNHFDSISAYETLEHTGRQGDWRFFFAQFSEFWRILRPGGMLFASVPSHGSIWMWGDPGHSRVINQGTLAFLDQSEYTKQIGVTHLTDYRHVYRADFHPVTGMIEGDEFRFVLSAIKPARIS
jgi:SAM-dependent methyltransferase